VSATGGGAYSATPLPRKLGLVTAKGGVGEVAALGEPEGFRGLLGELPESVKLEARLRATTALALCFVRTRAELGALMELLGAQLPRVAHVWVMHPKAGGSLTSIRMTCAMRDLRRGWWTTRFALSMRTGRG
jgi:hypothetical protein